MKKYIIYIAIIVLFVVCTFLFLKNRNNPPQISVSYSVESMEEESAIINWTVENLSDRVISFEDDCFVQITLNKKKVPFMCKALTLAPGEEKTIQIKLTNLIPDSANNLLLTSRCKEGTSATFRSTIKPEKEIQKN